MNNGLASPFVFNSQYQQQQQQQQNASNANAFSAMSNTNALSSAASMAMQIPSRKRSREDDHDEQFEKTCHNPTLQRKLAAPRSAIGNPTLAQWVELSSHENQSTLASLGLLPSDDHGNVNLFAQRIPAQGSSDAAFSAIASTTAGTPAMTGSPSSLFSEIPGMPPTPSDSHSALPRSLPAAHFQHHGSMVHNGYFDCTPTKQRTSSSASSRPCGILEPQLGLSGTDVAMDGSAVTEPSSHGPWCKSIPQLSVRADGTGSELWALCRDCGAFDKVNPTAFNPQPIAYSP
ncbi:hypothetical protein V8E36_003490 [Tilletia maclaganii]